MEMCLGLNAKTYHGAAGSDPSTELDIIGTAKLNLAVSEATLKLRASEFELTDVVLFQASIDFDILWDETNPSFLALWTAFITKAALAFKCLPKAGGKGLKADFKLVKFERNEDIENGIMASVSIKPTIGQTPAFV